MPKVVIHLGMSNCKGRAAMAGLPVEYQQTYTSIKVWNGTATASLDYSTNNNQFPASEQSNEFGCEFAMLSDLQTAWSEDIYYFKYGIGGSKIAFDAGAVTWNVAEVGELNDVATSNLNKFLAYLWNDLSLRTNYDIYFVQHHGENDGSTEADSLAFGTNLINLIQSRLNNLSGTAFTSSIKFIGIVENNSNNTSTYKANIKASYPSVVAAYSGTYTSYALDPDAYELQVDNTHYTATGYDDMGVAMATYIIANT